MPFVRVYNIPIERIKVGRGSLKGARAYIHSHGLNRVFSGSTERACDQFRSLLATRAIDPSDFSLVGICATYKTESEKLSQRPFLEVLRYSATPNARPIEDPLTFVDGERVDNHMGDLMALTDRFYEDMALVIEAESQWRLKAPNFKTYLSRPPEEYLNLV